MQTKYVSSPYHRNQMPSFNFLILVLMKTTILSLRDHSNITSAKRWVGSENGNFLLIYSTIYADVGGWVGLKKPKTC